MCKKIIDGNIVCKVCNEKKELVNFYHKDGYYNHTCKRCHSDKYKERVKDNPKKYKTNDYSNGTCICRTCEIEKPLSDFSMISGKYYQKDCKKCKLGIYRKIRLNKQKVVKVKEETQDMILFRQGYKICKECNETLPFSNFYRKNKKPKKLVRSCCILCKNKKNNHSQFLWRQSESGKNSLKKTYEKRSQVEKEQTRIKKEERQKIKEIKRIEREERQRNYNLNREVNRVNKNRRNHLRQKERFKNDEEFIKKVKEKRKLRIQERLKNDEEYRKKRNEKAAKKLRDKRQNNEEWRVKENKRKCEKWKERWNNDELFAIKVRMRNLIRNRLKRLGYPKRSDTRTEQILGCNYIILKEYFESKFNDGMNWENRGEWHIDHIIPLSSAKSEEEIYRLCHYTNLQPLWAEDNLKKSNKIL